MRSDEELMADYVSGDEACFGELFERYAQIIFRMLRRQIRQEEDVHELVQQTFLQLHRARHDFDLSRKLRPWLMTIAFNLKREFFRRKIRKPESPLDIEPMANSTRDHLETRDDNRRVRAALEKLPQGQRDVIAMHWFDELSFPEVAQVLGLSLSAVKVRAHRGYKRLRVELSNATADVTRNDDES